MEDVGKLFGVELHPGRVAVSGELDAGTSPVLTAAIAASSSTRLTVDLSSLAFIDSSGLRALLEASRRIAQSGGTMRIIANATVTRIVELAGMADVLDLATDGDGRPDR